MSTSPAKKFGFKRATELRNVSEFSQEEIESIKLTKCESFKLDNDKSNLKNTENETEIADKNKFNNCIEFNNDHN